MYNNNAVGVRLADRWVRDARASSMNGPCWGRTHPARPEDATRRQLLAAPGELALGIHLGEIGERIETLRPSVDEYARLRAALDATESGT
jgi:hypothetical protein